MQSNEDDLVDDIIHESAHALEEQYAKEIYGDNRIASEFMEKRKWVYSYMSFEDRTPPDEFLTELDFNSDVDNYLYKEIGYETLEAITSEIFLNPYSITSIREYWATGFEYLISGNEKVLENMCPVLYNKLEYIIK